MVGDSAKQLAAMIRKGCKNTSQMKHGFFRWDSLVGKQDLSCCAIGAAVVGCLGGIDAAREYSNEHTLDAFYVLKKCVDVEEICNQNVLHPRENDYYLPMWSAVVSLNDHYGWTREQIADWLDTL